MPLAQAFGTRDHPADASGMPLIRTLAYTADQLREIIYIAPLQGFRRVTQEFNSDDSKCRMDWNYVDEQIPPNIPPPNVVEVKASHRLNNTTPLNFCNYVGEITATYETSFATSPGNAYAIFWNLVNDRIGKDALKSLGVPVGLGGAAVADDQYSVWPINFSAAEPEIYGKSTAQFTFTYGLLFSPAVYLAAGLWRPVPGQNWGAWSQSMAATKPRGLVPGLGMYPADDIIVDLCVPQAYIPPTSASAASPAAVHGPGQRRCYAQAIRRRNRPTCIIPTTSPSADWTSDIIHKPLPTSPLVYSPPGSSGNAPFTGSGPYIPRLPINPPPALIQTRTAPTFYAVMTGRAPRSLPGSLRRGKASSAWEASRPCCTTRRVRGDGYRTFLMGDASYLIYGAVWQLPLQAADATDLRRPRRWPI